MKYLMLLCAATLCFVACSSESFDFVFMTDIHVQLERNAAAGFASAIQRVNQLDPDFVITGGDLVYDALGQNFSRADSLYDLFIDLSQKFTMPVYHTMGNHEVFGWYPESGVHADHAEYGKKMFQNRLGKGATYRSFDYKSWHFILLDAVSLTPDRRYEGRIDSLQMDWLQKDLQRLEPSTPIVLCTHIPLVSVYGQMTHGPLYAFSAGEVVTNALELLALFKERNLRLVLQGHFHEVEEIVYQGTRFITAGAVCGAWWQGARDGFPEGFVNVKIKNGDVSWDYLTFGWSAENESQ
ncbi:MAG: metallophosphoesterase [Calditrichaeota bacterium]|nr:MAG: metallophosphoesterase [Calditrichota bacterium]